MDPAVTNKEREILVWIIDSSKMWENSDVWERLLEMKMCSTRKLEAD
jgi:hypothetical protein